MSKKEPKIEYKLKGKDTVIKLTRVFKQDKDGKEYSSVYSEFVGSLKKNQLLEKLLPAVEEKAQEIAKKSDDNQAQQEPVKTRRKARTKKEE